MAEKSFHKVIVKHTGLFAVSQVIKIITRVIANKIAAVFLGPLGIGIIGLLENILGLVSSLTNFGIAESSIREIAIMDEDDNKLKRLVKIIYKWALITGFLGLITVCVFERRINKVVFENLGNRLLIFSLGAYFIFNTLSSMRIAVLKAKKRVEVIVKYNIISSVFSSLIAILGYYFYEIDAIIPVILLVALSNFFLSLYFTKNIEVSKQVIKLKEFLHESKPILKLGLFLSISVIFGQLCFYGIRLFLKMYSSFETLGIYQVANTILVGYLGVVFVAMSNDFYPRLCNQESDKKLFDNLINDQTELALLIVVPAILILYLLAPQILVLLYSKEFLDVLNILKIGLLAIIFKTIVWPLGFIPLVKGNKTLFLKQNVLGDLVNFITSLLFFYLYGLIGLGIALVTMFLVSGIYNYYAASKFYDFRFRKKTLMIIGVSLFFGILSMAIILYTDFKTFNFYILIILLFSLAFSTVHLKKILID